MQEIGWTQTSLQYWHQSIDQLDINTTDLGIVMLQDVKHLFKRFAGEEREQLTDAGATKIGPNVVVSRYPKRRDL